MVSDLPQYFVWCEFLGQVGRRQIDRYLLRRHRQAGGMQRCLYPLAALGHRLVGQADDLNVEVE